MSTIDRIVEALRAQPIASGAYSLELDDPPVEVTPYGAYAVKGTFRGLTWADEDYQRASPPSAPYEQPAYTVLLDAKYDEGTLVEFTRAWSSLLRRAFETMATHPNAKSVWLHPGEFGERSAHESLAAKALKQRAKNPHALRDLLEERHPLAAFIGAEPALYERTRALLEAERAEQGPSLGRSDGLELTLESFGWALASVSVTMNLVSYEPDESVRDITQQEMPFAQRAHFERPERMLAFLQALSEVSRERLAQLEPRRMEQTLTPLDVLGVPADLLDLKKPVTREDFVAALRRRWKL